jgi:hypothetical protein
VTPDRLVVLARVADTLPDVERPLLVPSTAVTEPERRGSPTTWPDTWMRPDG